MTTRYDGTAPWDEVWFVEAITDAGAGLWLRTTLRHDAAGAEVAQWAVWWDEHGIVTAWRGAPLETARLGADPWVAFADVAVGPHAAHGRAGSLRWDLAIEGPPPVDLVPPALDRLGIGRSYQPAVPDARLDGTVVVDGVSHRVRARGVVGHLWGAGSRVAQWGWCHAAGASEHGDVVVEGLSAWIGSPRVPPLSTLRLAVDDTTRTFAAPLELVRATARTDGQVWTLQTGRGGDRVTLRFQLPGSRRVALAQYPGPDGAPPTYCRNTTHGRLDLRWTLDGRRGTWRTARAIGEIASKVRPPGRVRIAPDER